MGRWEIEQRKKEEERRIYVERSVRMELPLSKSTTGRLSVFADLISVGQSMIYQSALLLPFSTFQFHASASDNFRIPPSVQ